MALQTYESLRSPLPAPISSSSPNSFDHRKRSDSNEWDSSDDDWGEGPSYIRDAIIEKGEYSGWRYLVYGGGLGHFLFTTTTGGYMAILVMVLWLVVWQTETVIANRIILWSGYLAENYTSHTKLMYLIAKSPDFPYPHTTTWMQMILAHGFILSSASITRLFRSQLVSAGLSRVVAPFKAQNLPRTDASGTIHRFLGIAGGGIFEFNISMVKQVMPVAATLLARNLLSTISSEHIHFQLYVLTHCVLLPLSLLFTASLLGTTYRILTIFFALKASIAIASSHSRPGLEFTPVSSALCLCSVAFAALYPVQITRIYKIVLDSCIPQGESLATKSSGEDLSIDLSGSRHEARAYWRILHYTSTLSILLHAPFVIFSGEFPRLLHNNQHFNVFFYWAMNIYASIGYSAVLMSTIALTRATSPLVSSFTLLPSLVILLPFMRNGQLPAYGWVGFVWFWISGLCFWLVRWREGIAARSVR